MPLRITHLKTVLKLLFFATIFLANEAEAQVVTRTIETGDSTLSKSPKFPAYRWKDSYLNRFSYDLATSPLLNLNIDSLSTVLYFQPGEDNISVEEKIGKDFDSKLPTSMSFNEYSSLQNSAVRQSILRDYERLQDGNSKTSGRGLSPLLKKNPIADRIFGGKAPEFKPNGFISVDLGVRKTFNNNPQIPLLLREQTLLDFDQQISVNFNSLFNNSNSTSPNYQGGQNQQQNIPDIGKLGKTLGGLAGAGRQAREKVNILGNIDTKSAFSYENQLKLNFKNEPEDILQSLELGNVSFPLSSQLIPGVDKLLGFKAGLKFGKLDISTVFAQQTSRTESILINGGNLSRPFEIRVDSYDENRHFFLGQFFRDNYETSLKTLPMVTSEILITRVELYVTNRTNSVESMRNLVGMADLGENAPFNANITATGADAAASNAANVLGDLLKSSGNSAFRAIDQTNIALTQAGLRKGVDFEILRGAKKLTDREYHFHPKLGYVSLLTPLRNDEILAVAYEYIYKGKSYRVGELTEDYSIRPEDQVVALKLLKSSTIRNQLDNPMWNLMMKNVYSLGQGQIERDGFQLRVIYKDDATGMDSPNLPETSLKAIPLIELLGLDRLNFNNDLQKDGNFDYVEDITINPLQGFLIFPQLEPFGDYLRERLSDQPNLQQKYVFDELYDRTLTDAQQVNTKNKFFLQGSVQSSGKDIPLPLGATGGSVRVYSGGTQLQEGVDYQVDAQIGRIRLINPSILASGRSIRIDYERPDLFQAQIRRLFGIRANYTVGRNLRIGATFMDLKENTPGFLTRTAIGNEPVNNTLWGFDVNYKKEGSGLTRFLDKLPGIQTKEPSSILFSAEFAQLIPGVSNKVNNNAMIDDFEAARTVNDLTRQPRRWRLASTPENFVDPISPIYGYNFKRAKISAYTIDLSTFNNLGLLGGGSIVPREVSEAAAGNIFERGFQIQEIFPGRSRPVLGQNLPTQVLDISYFPHERGMYNYNTDLTSRGLLKNPEENFGAVMRGITFDADFDNSNVEYLEFWMLNPFAESGGAPTDAYTVRDGIFNRANTTGGKLIFHLGDISEDVIPDSRFNFENGLPGDADNFNAVENTNWGVSPVVQYVTDAFDNSEEAREQQDVGLEGLNNEKEREFGHIKDFLDDLRSSNTLDSDALQQIEEDPSADDFNFFLDPKFTNQDFIVERFKNYLGMENNTPPINDTEVLTPASDIVADKEDINRDNTINDVEGYHEYEFDITPDKMRVGENFIVDQVTSSNNAKWYLFRIPIRKPQKSVNITGFKSIRFMRMLMTEWEQPVVLRFATLQLVANQYRTYLLDLNDNSFQDVPETYDADFKVTTVSVEENGCTEDGNCNVKEGQTPYVVPPGFIRDRDLTGNVFRQFNEQSVALSVDGLKAGDKRGIFKNTDLNLNMYKRVKMFVHMENEFDTDNIGGAFLRFGTDLKRNYYEVELLGLKATPKGSVDDANIIWPDENEFDFALNDLREFKVERNRNLGNNGTSLDNPYSRVVTIDGTTADGMPITRTYRLSVVGNPDLSTILVWMVGQSNPLAEEGNGAPQSFKIWVNELRANGFDQTKGEALIMAADIKLADIGNISMSANMSTFGFGGVQSGISSRTQETAQGFGVASTLEIDKFFPQKWGLSIPFFINYDEQTIKPHFNPLDPDIVLERSLEQFETEAEKMAYRNLVTDNTVNRGFNFANVRKIKTDPNAKSHIYDIENFTLSYARNSLTRSNVLIQEYLSEQEKGALAYQFSPRQVLWEPFAKNEKLDRRFLQWLKDFNFSPIPNLLSFRTDFDRNFIKTQYYGVRNASLNTRPQLDTSGIAPQYIKYFNVNRYYDMQWDFTKSIDFTYSSVMNAAIDEPFGERNREAVWDNLKSFGRARNFQQSLQLNYALPLDKFFLLDWIKSDSYFNTDYTYRANAYNFDRINIDGSIGGGILDVNGDEFGNFIENQREYGFRGNIDLVQLYNKIKYLKFANSPNAPKARFTRIPGVEDEVEVATSDLMKKFTRLLMTVRGINFNFVRTEGTILPGFTSTPYLLGTARGFNEPGLDFALLGSQNRDIHRTAAQNGWLSESQIRNDPFTQTRQTKFDFSTTLEPWKGFRMRIFGNYTRGDSYQEIFKPGEGGGAFESFSPFRNGTFSMSFWSFKTVFKKMSDDPKTNYRYEIFENMKANREQVINKLNALNGGEAAGYHPNSQDVLIPAFFAAYSGNTVDKLYDKVDKKGQQTFNPFLQFPLPNWRIDYSGLNKLPGFNKVFKSLTFNHSYSSTYSVGNFTSSLLYGAELVGLGVNDYRLGDKFSEFGGIDGNASFFLPIFIMSSVTMEERYAPLIGFNYTFKNNISGRVQWNKERRASLNLSNTQVSEYSSDDFVTGLGFKKSGIKLPFRKADGNKVVLKNDVDFSFNLTIRDIKLLQRRLDVEYNGGTAAENFGEVTPIQGNYNFQLRPQIGYKFNNKLSMTLFFEHFKNLPFTSITFARSQTVGGVNMRLNLAD